MMMEETQVKPDVKPVSDTVHAFFYNMADAIGHGKFKTVKSELNRSFNKSDEKYSPAMTSELPVNVTKACMEYTHAVNSFFDFKEREDRKGHFIMSEYYLNNIATALEESNMTDQARNVQTASVAAVVKGDPTSHHDTENFMKHSVSEITGKPVLVWAPVSGPTERPFVPS